MDAKRAYYALPFDRSESQAVVPPDRSWPMAGTEALQAVPSGITTLRHIEARHLVVRGTSHLAAMAVDLGLISTVPATERRKAPRTRGNRQSPCTFRARRPGSSSPWPCSSTPGHLRAKREPNSLRHRP